MIEGLEVVPTPRRRPHDRTAPHLVPAIAARSGDPVVQELIKFVEQIYPRRHCLRSELRGDKGRLIIAAFPELLARPPRKKGRGKDAVPLPDEPDYEARRSDGFEADMRVLLAMAACCTWKTMELRDPSGGNLAVHRLAELAELPFHLVAPKDDDDRNRRFRMDAVERSLRRFRTARILSFTKQHREQLPDGSYTTSAPALRKLSPHLFRKCGEDVRRTFDWRRGKVKKARKSRRWRRNRDRAPGFVADIRVAEAMDEISRARPALRSVPAAAAPPATPTLTMLVRQEHPDWPFADVLQEAERRARELEPPTGGAGAPPATE